MNDATIEQFSSLFSNGGRGGRNDAIGRRHSIIGKSERRKKEKPKNEQKQPKKQKWKLNYYYYYSFKGLIKAFQSIKKN